MKHYEMKLLSFSCMAMGVLAMPVPGQVALLIPARRASRVPSFVTACSA